MPPQLVSPLGVLMMCVPYQSVLLPRFGDEIFSMGPIFSLLRVTLRLFLLLGTSQSIVIVIGTQSG